MGTPKLETRIRFSQHASTQYLRLFTKCAITCINVYGKILLVYCYVGNSRTWTSDTVIGRIESEMQLGLYQELCITIHRPLHNHNSQATGPTPWNVISRFQQIRVFRWRHLDKEIVKCRLSEAIQFLHFSVKFLGTLLFSFCTEMKITSENGNSHMYIQNINIRQQSDIHSGDLIETWAHCSASVCLNSIIL